MYIIGYVWHEKVKGKSNSQCALLSQHDIDKGKDYSGAKFSYTEPIFLNKAHSTKWKAFDNKTLYLYNHSHW